MFSLCRPRKKLKIQWIEFFSRSAGGKFFNRDEILEYCKYHSGSNRKRRRQKLLLHSRPEHNKPYADNQECYGNCRWDLRGFLFVHGCFDRTEFRDFLSLMVVETGVDESNDTQDNEDDSDNDHEALHKLEPITTAMV